MYIQAAATEAFKTLKLHTIVGLFCHYSRRKLSESNTSQVPQLINEYVYLVEDDAALRQSIKDLLGFVGYHVRDWPNAERFLEESPLDSPAVLITDVRMDAISGVDLHAKLLEQGRSLPVIYISGETTVQESIQAMKQGAHEFLLKPFGREDLLHAVAKGMQRDRQNILNVSKQARFNEARKALNERECKLHDLLLKGYNNQEIMDAMAIALPTAKQYKSEVMRKLGVRTLAQLIEMSEQVNMDAPMDNDTPET